MINFAYTILYVQDVEASLLFYENAFGLSRKFIAPDNTYGELITGSTTLAFAKTSLAAGNLAGGFLESKPTDKPFGIEIGFTTNDVEETLSKAVAAGAAVAAEPRKKPWGQTVAYVRDVNGFLVELCTPMG